MGRGPRDPPEHSSFAMEASAPVSPTPQGTVGTGVWGPGHWQPQGTPAITCQKERTQGRARPAPGLAVVVEGLPAEGVLGAGVT